ncbi:MAG: DPP IV N-terminal domain-containing protein [Bacteroidales bacterium]|nr:DPP IV N-terminal domain-containing protein [Bacteroidales bacterium]
MKRSILSCTAMILGLMAYAQGSVCKIHPANPSDGKILTMEETILSRQLSPSWPDLKLDRQQPEAPIAETKDQSLWVNGVCVAESEEDGIVYGESVSRNEFGIDGGIFVSPDKSKVAFYRKDERAVTQFPLLDIKDRTGKLRLIRYPMAGMTSENIKLGIYDVASGRTVWCKVDDFDDERYLTNISWTPDSRKVIIQVLDRAQENVHMNMYSASDGRFLRTILTEQNDRYVEPQDPVWFLEGRGDIFLYRTDNRDAYRNLYLCDTLGTVTRLTDVDADVHYVANDGRFVYYTSAEVSPVENHLFRKEIKFKKKGKIALGAAQRLTFAEGWHNMIRIENGCKSFVDHYSSLNNPGTVERIDVSGKKVAYELLSQAKDPTEGYAFTEIDLGTVKSADGLYDNWYRLIKPINFDPSKKYPVIVYVYGGPHSQMVQNTWLAQLRRWEMYMAQRGYLVYVQDNRGTQNRGAEFEKAIHRQCGQCEMADQMVGVEMLKSLPYVDADRIGVHGWSYGGFMTISLMTNYPETFKVGVAGGPVIDWKWYEVMYGERYMDTPEKNPEGFAKTSLINKAGDLKGKLLICQGAVDNTVVWEHSLSFIQECIDREIPVDYFPYPVAEHNVFGRNRIHLMDKVSLYFEDYL